MTLMLAYRLEAERPQRWGRALHLVHDKLADLDQAATRSPALSQESYPAPSLMSTICFRPRFRQRNQLSFLDLLHVACVSQKQRGLTATSVSY